VGLDWAEAAGLGSEEARGWGLVVAGLAAEVAGGWVAVDWAAG